MERVKVLCSEILMEPDLVRWKVHSMVPMLFVQHKNLAVRRQSLRDKNTHMKQSKKTNSQKCLNVIVRTRES